MEIIFLTFLLLRVTEGASSINAVQMAFPFRNGKIYVMVAGTGYESFDFSLQYYEKLPTSPATAIMSIRTIEIVNTTCNSIDYSFTTENVTDTGFDLRVVLSQNYNIFYKTLVIDYLAMSVLPDESQCFITNPFPVSTYEVTTPTGKYERKWTWNQRTFFNIALYLFTTYIQKMVALFPSGNLYLDTANYLGGGGTTQSVKLIFNSDIVITTLEAGMFGANSSYGFKQNFTQYKFNDFQTSFTSASTTYSIASRAFPNLFVGIPVMYYSVASSKFEFTFYYNTQFSDNSSYKYVQAHPSDTIIFNQSMSQNLVVRFYEYSRINCSSDSTYKLLDYQSQLCYDTCPDNMYQQTIYCKKCIKCTSKTTCTTCYQTACSIGQLFDTSSTPYKCSTCLTKITNCFQCFANITNQYCSYCNVSMNLGISSDQKSCVACSLNSYIDIITGYCALCSNIFIGCQTCSFAGATCTSCTVASSRQLVSGSCVSCNSTTFYYSGNKTCLMCDLLQNDCESCVYNNNFTVNCTLCTVVSQKQILGNECVPCNPISYYEESTRTCQSCSEYCVSCTSDSNCLKCQFNEMLTSKLQDGYCTLCNDNDPQSALPLCAPIECLLSTYNFKTRKCEATDFTKIIVESLTFLGSIPTLNVFTQVFSGLLSMLDDLSYYTYHGRNYTEQVEIFLAEMSNFTIQKFIPFQVPIDTDLWGYKGDILQNDLNKTPAQFQEADGDIYFLNNTQSIWTVTFPISILTFWVLHIVHWLINRFVKNNTFKNYNYFGMIFVDLIGANLQYLSFRIFSQFYQSVFLGPQYIVNIMVCHFVLLIAVIYSMTSFALFKTLYEKVDSQYVLEDIFGESWIVWFILYNLIKIFTGFVHAYFYYNPFIQTTLLTVVYFLRMVIHSCSLKHMLSKFEYAFEFCNYLMMFVLQCFFLIQIIVMQYGSFSSIMRNNLGIMEAYIIVIMVVSQFLAIIVFSTKNIIVMIRARCILSLEKQAYSDIKIQRVRKNTLNSTLPASNHSKSREKTNRIYQNVRKNRIMEKKYQLDALQSESQQQSQPDKQFITYNLNDGILKKELPKRNKSQIKKSKLKVIQEEETMRSQQSKTTNFLRKRQRNREG